jgi:aminoglycoside N3'-acetyltransferase
MYVLGHIAALFRRRSPGPRGSLPGPSLTVPDDRAAGAVNAHLGPA